MKKAIEKEGLKVHYMCQPVAYRTYDATKKGYESLPECPFGKFKEYLEYVKPALDGSCWH